MVIHVGMVIGGQDVCKIEALFGDTTEIYDENLNERPTQTAVGCGLLLALCILCRSPRPSSPT